MLTISYLSYFQIIIFIFLSEISFLSKFILNNYKINKLNSTYDDMSVLHYVISLIAIAASTLLLTVKRLPLKRNYYIFLLFQLPILLFELYTVIRANNVIDRPDFCYFPDDDAVTNTTLCSHHENNFYVFSKRNELSQSLFHCLK